VLVFVLGAGWVSKMQRRVFADHNAILAIAIYDVGSDLGIRIAFDVYAVLNDAAVPIAIIIGVLFNSRHRGGT
jgi:hypothetical protein